MANAESERRVSKDEIIKIYSDFMTRITQFEELVSISSRFLVGFHQALGFLGRPSFDKTSTLVERIIKAHSSSRVLSYVEAGCVNSHDSVQNVSKSKIVVDELKCLMDGAASIMQTAKGNKEDDDLKLDSFITSSHEGIVTSSISYYVQGLVMKVKGPVFATAFSPLMMIIVAVMGSFILAEKIYLGGVIGSVIIVVGLYAVLWGKYKEEKEEKQKRKLLEIPEAIKDNNNNNNNTQLINGNVQLMIGNGVEAKADQADKCPSIAIDLPPNQMIILNK